MQNSTPLQIKGVEEVISIADACLGGLAGRSTLLIGPEEQRLPYVLQLQQAKMKYIYQEDSPVNAASIIPHIQLLISVPPFSRDVPLLSAAAIARGCIGRRTPLL